MARNGDAAVCGLRGRPPAGGWPFLAEAEDGVVLRAAFWPAPEQDGPTPGAVVLCQGRSEYVEKSYEIVTRLRARGFAVCAFDWRGQGLSERLLPNRRKGHVEDFDAYQRDLDAVLMRAPLEGPLILGGHSMGGLSVLRFLHRRPGRAAAAFATAPMLGIAGHWAMWLMARGLAQSAPMFDYDSRFAFGCDTRTVADRGFVGNQLTSDEARFNAHAAMLEAHPELALGGVTWGWLRAAFREMDAIGAAPRNWLSTPTLLVEAGRDSVVDNARIRAFAESHDHAELLSLPLSEHEPLMERDEIQSALWEGLDRFFARALPAS